MEQALMELGLKDGIFVALFVWLLIYVLKTSKERENKLYTFLDDMKNEFRKLVGSYENLSKDVREIRQELSDFKYEYQKDNKEES
ncbi:holin [Geobacillus phage GR1]|nr:holin [Geobacillus phage GR1]